MKNLFGEDLSDNTDIPIKGRLTIEKPGLQDVNYGVFSNNQISFYEKVSQDAPSVDVISID